MKTKLASFLVLAAALSISFSAPLHAAPKSTSAHAISVRTVNQDGWEVSRGTPVRTLVNRFGAPAAKLSDNVWVYSRFYAVQNHPQARECDTLIVTLADGVIADLHLVNKRAQVIIAARVRTGAPLVVAVAR